MSAAAPAISSAASATGQVGVAFTYQITATNTPTSFNATGLPAGLAVNTSTGAISGTPTTAAATNVTLSATNASGTGTKTLKITVLPLPPAITSATTATAQVGVAFTYQTTATNSPTGYTATGLPAGLAISATTGKITGTPTLAGASTLTLTATNTGGSGTATLTLTINPAKPVISSATTATGQVGVAFTYQITASNTPPNFNATPLPAGLSVNTSTGVISGTPTTAAATNVTLSATNAGGTGSATLKITVLPPPPVITSATTATGQVGVAFSYQATATNSPTTYSATGLPAGLAISTAGKITGTPTAPGTASIALTATNTGGSDTATLTLTVNPAKPVVSSALTATGPVGVAFTYQITASNTPTSFNATGLPAGLTVNPTTGVISGTPTAVAATNVTISATNSGGTGSATLKITVLPSPPVITSATTATGQVGVAFSYQATATNSPMSYSATGLPAGLVISTAGKITGTPTAAGTSSITLTATNTGGSGTATLTLTLNPAKPVISSALTASGQVSTAFSYQITASNSPTSFNATGLPAGLSVSTSTGLITGTPATAATSNITISAINAGGTGTAVLKLTIAPNPPVITSPATATGQTGVAFTYQIAATNTPTSFSATGLPAGLTVTTTTGKITGTPTATGVSSVSLGATNATGTGSATLTLTVSLGKPLISSALAASGQVGVAFTYQITGTNSPTSYNATGLPPGLTINKTTGAITGTPTTVKVTNVAISAINATGTGSATLVVTVNSPSPVITSAPTANGQIGAAFTYQILASNSPTSFNATGLPAGLVVSSATGAITGTPTATGSFGVSISATNAGGTGTATLALTVAPPAPPMVSPPTTGLVFSSSTPVSLSFNASSTAASVTKLEIYRGGTLVGTLTSPASGTTWTFTEGSNLPPGTYTYTARAYDAYGNTVDSTPVTVTVLAALPYTTDFEPSDGYTLGSLNGQLGWTVGPGASVVSNQDFSHGAQSVLLSPSNPPSVIGQAYSPDLGETVEFFDFFAKPVAGTPPGIASTFTVEQSEFAFQLSGSTGILSAFSGNGSGGGTWVTTPFSIPLGANNQALSWVRLTARLDFTSQRWDLYANSQMVAADIPFISSSSSLSIFQLQGALATASGLDDIFVGPTNPLFADVNQDGIDDAWETAHGLSLSVNDRNLTPAGNGVTVLQSYLAGTDPTDFYNGTAPTLTILSGDQQSAAPGQFNAQPLVVTVLNAAGTASLANAPVTFTVQSGGGLLASANTGSPALSQMLSLTTDANGNAQVFYQQPATAGVSSQILCTAGSASVIFNTTSTTGALTGPVGISGLRLWLKADAGITADGSGKVSTWADQSGLNNSATQPDSSAQPVLVVNQANGNPVVHFDGTGYLNLPDVMQGISSGEILAVVKMADNPGQNNTLWQFGVGAGSGYYNEDTFDDFGPGDSGTYAAAPLAAAEQYHIYNVSHDDTQPYWAQRFNGIIELTRTGEYSAFTSTPVIGGTTVHDMLLKGDIAEIIIYDHALTAQDRESLGAYLTAKYAPPAITIPAAPSLSGATTSTTATLTWTGASADLHTITVLERQTGSDSFAVVGQVTDDITFTDTGLAPGQTYQYRVKVGSYAGSSDYSNVVAVTTTTANPQLPTAGLRLWLKADAGVTADASGNVSFWQDYSGLGNSATQVITAAQPVLVAGQLNAQPVIRFAGSSYLNLPDVMNGIPSGDIIAVVKMADQPGQNNTLWQFGVANGSGYYNDDTFDDFGPGNPSPFTATPLAAAKDYHVREASAANGQSWQLRFNGVLSYSYTDGTYTAFNHSPVIGGTTAHDMLLQGDIAEILIYDHVLSAQERSAIQSYLYYKYLIPIYPYTLATTDPTGDADGDGLSNAAEVNIYHTDPTNVDTDGDGMSDSYEVAMGLNPLVADGTSDLDGDGVINQEDARPNDPAIGRLTITISPPSP